MLILAHADATITAFVAGLICFTILVFAIVSPLACFGVETASFVALLGALAFAIGFALQGALANFADGLLILIFRPYKVGDFITAGGTAGTVREIQLFSTSPTTPASLHVIVPNGKIGSDTITNHSAFNTRPLDLTIGISYRSSIEDAARTLIGAMKGDPRVLGDPSPQVLVTELGESSANLLMRCWVNRMAEGGFFVMCTELTRRAKEAFDASGIEIPLPHSTSFTWRPRCRLRFRLDREHGARRLVAEQRSSGMPYTL